MEERRHKYRKEVASDRSRYWEKQRDKDRSRRDGESEREKNCDAEDRYCWERERARKKKRDREREIEVEYQRGGRGERERDINQRKRERSKDVDCDDFVDEDVREHDTKRHRRDAGGARPRKNSEEEDSVTKENKATHREELEDEDEMETRRRRVQQWHERVKGEAHGDKCMEGNVDELKSAETRTLSDDDNKELRGDSMLVGSENVRAATEPALQNGDDATGDDELDPLDAYMNPLVSAVFSKYIPSGVERGRARQFWFI